jgi:hypothetical protein
MIAFDQKSSSKPEEFYQERKVFFSEEKKQKTFKSLSRTSPRRYRCPAGSRGMRDPLGLCLPGCALSSMLCRRFPC